MLLLNVITNEINLIKSIIRDLLAVYKSKLENLRQAHYASAAAADHARTDRQTARTESISRLSPIGVQTDKQKTLTKWGSHEARLNRLNSMDDLQRYIVITVRDVFDKMYLLQLASLHYFCP